MPATGYDDEDMDCGSDTDPYDDQAVVRDAGDDDDDEDFDIEVYEDEGDDMDDESGDTDAEGQHESQQWHVVSQQQQPQQQQPTAQPLPEDEPWPGIEDNMSDGENMDPLSVEDEHDDISERSSQPSEYPSTQRAWHISSDADGAQRAEHDGVGFRIHEDQDVGPGSLATPWP